MIYLWRQKLDTNWYADVKWLLVNERRKPEMVAQIQFILITLLIGDYTASIISPQGKQRIYVNLLQALLWKSKSISQISSSFHFKFLLFYKFFCKIVAISSLCFTECLSR